MRPRSIVRENKIFFIFHTLLFIAGIYPLVMFEKVALFLRLNSFYHPLLDQFFYYVTFLGSCKLCFVCMATLVMTKQDTRTLLAGAGSFVTMSVIIQGMKRLGCFDQRRPITWIPTDAPLHLVKGITHYTHLSFPSGHAGTIFAAVCLIHLLAPKKPCWFSVLLLLLACAVAYSRIYLCQHFYRDVYIGALIGTCTTFAVYTLLRYWQGPAWLDQTLFDLWPMKASPKA